MVKVELLRVLSVVGGKRLHISPSRGVCNNPTFAYLSVSACVLLCFGHEGVSAKELQRTKEVQRGSDSAGVGCIVQCLCGEG